MSRIILHVDMDAFYAAIEQRDHPEWKGKPVVVGSGRNERGVVSTASYEARKFGIHSAMPSRTAGKLCPDAVFVRPNMARYSEVSRQVFKILERFTPDIEPVSVDEAFLDVSGATKLFGDGLAIANQIRGNIRRDLNLTASVGVAPNKFLAKLSSDMNKPDGVTVVPNDGEGIRRFLAPLPVGKLWGVGKVMRVQLEQHGLMVIGDIQSISLAALQSLFTERVATHLKALSVGEDERPVEFNDEEKSISREHTFDDDSTNPQLIRQKLLALTVDVGRRLRASGKYASVVHIKLRWKSFETLTRQLTLKEPVCDDASLRAACLELWSKMKLVAPVRLVGMGVTGLADKQEKVQLTLIDESGRGREKQERLSRTVDAIRSKFGKDSILRSAESAADKKKRLSR